MSSSSFPKSQEGGHRRTDKRLSNKQAELLIDLASIGGGLLFDSLSHRWDIAFVITLALNCFLRLIRFVWVYGETLDTITEWIHGAANPITDIDQIRTTIRQVRDNGIWLDYVVPPPTKWPFKDFFEDATKEFRETLISLHERDYTIVMKDILEVSVRVVDEIEQAAFCTALADNLKIFETTRGKELLASQHKKAVDLARGSGRAYGFTRLFIFKSLDRIERKHLELMRQNMENCIEVLVAEEKDVGSADFGLWRSDLLMEIQNVESELKLHVSQKDDHLKNARLLKSKLTQRALAYKDFMNRFTNPPNLGKWSTQPESLLNLDPPDGPHASDCKMIIDRACDGLGDGSRLAVYGLTAPLIQGVKEFINGHQTSRVDVVDARRYAPAAADSHPRMEFVKANWLEWECKEKYSAIVADDVLCNLTYWQTPLFFEIVAKNLTPGGKIVMRTTANFAPGLENPSWREFISSLRRFDPGDERYEKGLNLEMLSRGAVLEAAWPTLHGPPFYSQEERSFRLGDWNDKVQHEPGLGTPLRNRLKFLRDVRITSMRYDPDLEDCWKPWFEKAQKELPAFSLWGSDEQLKAAPGSGDVSGRFHDYYQIIVLQKV